MNRPQECIFCAISKGSIKSDVVFQDEEVIVIKDKFPQAPIHLLVMPCRHVSDINQADERLVGSLLTKAANLAKEHGFSDSGYRIIINTGKNGGQEVPHLHIHVLAGEPIGPLRTRRKG